MRHELTNQNRPKNSKQNTYKCVHYDNIDLGGISLGVFHVDVPQRSSAGKGWSRNSV